MTPERRLGGEMVQMDGSKQVLRQKAIEGVGWSAGATTGRQLVRVMVSIVLARLLTPEDFGLVSMVMVFAGFAGLFAELGFGIALIQRPEVEERHLSSVFWLNLGMGLLLSASFWLASPLIASFYDEPRLASLAAAIGVNFTLSALFTVQMAQLRRRLEFRLLATAEVTALLAGGFLAVGLAFAGFGVWSLIWQLLATSAVTAMALHWRSGWRPHRLFDRAAISELFGFSANLMGFNVSNYWIRQGDALLIGRFIGSQPLGVYRLAYSLMLLPLQQVTAILSSVMLSTLSRVQEDLALVRRTYLRGVAAIALVTFPMMAGLLVTAEDFVLVVLGAQWSEMVPTLRVFCVTGMLQSVGTTVGWLYQSQGRTDLMFKWGLGAGSLLIASIVFGVWMGTIFAVACSYSVMSILLSYPGIAIPGRLVGVSPRDVVRSIGGIFLCASAMAAGVWGLGTLLPPDWPRWLSLAVDVGVGLVVYPALVHMAKLRAYLDVRGIAKEQWQSYRLRGP